MDDRTNVLRTRLGLVLAVTAAAASPAAAVLMIRGPAYSPAAGGSLAPVLASTPGRTAGNGVAVGYASTYNAAGDSTGTRAVRWSAAGGAPLEFGTLGLDAFGMTVNKVYAQTAAGTVAVGSAERYLPEDLTVYGTRAVRWDATGHATELGHLGTNSVLRTTSEAVAVNEAGVAVGYAHQFDELTDQDLGPRAVRWDADSTMAVPLGLLGTGSNGIAAAAAVAVNQASVAVGYAVRYDDNHLPRGQRAVRWNAAGVAAELAALGADANESAAAAAYAINDAGVAVGQSTRYDGDHNDLGKRPVRWMSDSNAAHPLGLLGTAVGDFTEGEALGVNASGAAIGWVRAYDVSHNERGVRAVRWDASSDDAHELQTFAGVADITYTFANAMNDAKVAVGWAEAYDANGGAIGAHAVLWNADGSILDLNTLLPAVGDSGWLLLTEARDISNTNWLTGVGLYDPDGDGGVDAYERMFLMQVPEPLAGLPILCAGLALRRRRDRA